MNKSFAFMHPELVSEWSEKNLPLTSEDITYGSKKIYWWKGPCGHECQASPKSRSAGEKCPICSGDRVVPGINDLQSLKPDIAEEWSSKNDLKPSEVTLGSHRKGRCGHEWTASVKSRVNGTGSFYAVKEGFHAYLNTDEGLGIPVDAYIPELKLVIDIWTTERNNKVKKFLFERNGITYAVVPDGIAVKETEVLRKVREDFCEVHIYISSDEEKDEAFIRSWFFM